MVVIRPRSMPKASWSTLASGARQLVVQDALLMIVCEPSYFSWLTPMTMVRSSPVAGAEMTTFLAPPASTCLRASSALVKKPVDSTTTSTPRSPHGRLAGSRSESTFMVLPLILMPSPSAATSSDSTPRTLSYLSRCARTSGLVRSLTATISMSLPLAAAARHPPGGPGGGAGPRARPGPPGGGGPHEKNPPPAEPGRGVAVPDRGGQDRGDRGQDGVAGRVVPRSR